jgi:hypothetical protein
MTAENCGVSLPRMTLWELTIVIFGLIWVLGSILVVLGATWLVRHEPS